MKRISCLVAVLLTLGFTGFAMASSPATPAADATPSFLEAPTTPCEEARWLGDPPPGTECCGGGLIPDGCSGACYVEIYCPDGRYLGCYGSSSSSCAVEGEYVRCEATYYSCDQCKADYPFALGCEYC